MPVGAIVPGDAEPYQVILDRASFRVELGRSLGILAGNGVGKATIINMMAGLEKPDEGVLRKHAQMLADAGVDTLIRSILEVSSELRQMTDRLASAFSWFGETLKLKEQSVAGLPAAESDIPQAPQA